MEANELNSQSDHVLIQVALDAEVVEWLDSLKIHLGLRSRGDLLNRLLHEIKGEAEPAE